MACRRYLDEATFVIEKDCLDSLRRTRRELRDEFQARAARAARLVAARADVGRARRAARPAGARAAGRGAGRSRNAARDRAARAGRPACVAGAPHDVRLSRRTDPLTAAVRELVGAARDRALDPRSRGPAGRGRRAAVRGPCGWRSPAGSRPASRRCSTPCVGEELAPTDAGECTRLVTWYIGGTAPGDRAPRCTDGRREQRPFRREGGALEVDLGGPGGRDRPPRGELADVPAARGHAHRHPGHRVALDGGLASGRRRCSPRRTSGRRSSTPSSTCCGTRTPATSGSSSRSTTTSWRTGRRINAVGVLSRADEIGSCRLDALEVAARVAERYRARSAHPPALPAGAAGRRAARPGRDDAARGGVPGAGDDRRAARGRVQRAAAHRGPAAGRRHGPRADPARARAPRQTGWACSASGCR